MRICWGCFDAAVVAALLWRFFVFFFCFFFPERHTSWGFLHHASPAEENHVLGRAHQGTAITLQIRVMSSEPTTISMRCLDLQHILAGARWHEACSGVFCNFIELLPRASLRTRTRVGYHSKANPTTRITKRANLPHDHPPTPRTVITIIIRKPRTIFSKASSRLRLCPISSLHHCVSE